MRRLVWLVPLLTVGYSTAALAEGERGSFKVRVVVPAYCEIESDAIVLRGSDGFQIGSVFESCNSADGFQVVASHRGLNSAERIRLTYAGVTTQLNATGWTPVAYRPGPKLGNSPVGVQYTTLDEPVAITLALTYL